MIESGWDEAMYASFADWMRCSGPATPGGRTVERDGLIATICPAVPERSIFNSVAYSDPAVLRARASALDDFYEREGVKAWTVWVPESDRASARMLETHGHVLDGRPQMMKLDLSHLPLPGRGDLDWVEGVDYADVARINEAAYDHAPGEFAPGIGAPEADHWRTWGARVEGELVSVLITSDVGTDCGVYFVATLEHARGRGIARRLMGVALSAAARRGMKTSTLQASAAGRPVYERLGYESLGVVEMWEKRRR